MSGQAMGNAGAKAPISARFDAALKGPLFHGYAAFYRGQLTFRRRTGISRIGNAAFR
jgi:hypothetical protein